MSGFSCDDTFNDNFSMLSQAKRKIIYELQSERSSAILQWFDGEISKQKVRAIVARCNHEIARIAEVRHDL